MIAALDLKQGMALRIEGQIYKVLEVEAKAGTAKLGGVVRAKLCNVSTGACGNHTSARKSAWRTCNSSGT